MNHPEGERPLYLGNLDALRDWGHAKDYVKAMWLMLQQEKPEDFVIATGVATKVRDFVQMSFEHVGFKIRWEGKGINEVGILDSVDEQKYLESTGQSLNLPVSNLLNSVIVKVDPQYFRPTEVDLLLGDPTKSKTQLGWEPEYDLAGLVKDMMDSDIKLVQKDIHLVEKGHEVFRQSE
jgi:GDPmannose 4,6-dehydratase